jgi:hypothetical protein
MTDTDIHSCGYYCNRPACIEAQRNELRDKLFEIRTTGTFIHISDKETPESSQPWVKTYSGGKPNYTQPIEKEWVELTDDEMLMIYAQPHEGFKYSLGRMVQAKLKEKNT